MANRPNLYTFVDRNETNVAPDYLFSNLNFQGFQPFQLIPSDVHNTLWLHSGLWQTYFDYRSPRTADTIDESVTQRWTSDTLEYAIGESAISAPGASLLTTPAYYYNGLRIEVDEILLTTARANPLFIPEAVNDLPGRIWIYVNTALLTDVSEPFATVRVQAVAAGVADSPQPGELTVRGIELDAAGNVSGSTGAITQAEPDECVVHGLRKQFFNGPVGFFGGVAFESEIFGVITLSDKTAFTAEAGSAIQLDTTVYIGTGTPASFTTSPGPYAFDPGSSISISRNSGPIDVVDLDPATPITTSAQLAEQFKLDLDMPVGIIDNGADVTVSTYTYGVDSTLQITAATGNALAQLGLALALIPGTATNLLEIDPTAALISTTAMSMELDGTLQTTGKVTILAGGLDVAVGGVLVQGGGADITGLVEAKSGLTVTGGATTLDGGTVTIGDAQDFTSGPASTMTWNGDATFNGRVEAATRFSLTATVSAADGDLRQVSVGGRNDIHYQDNVGVRALETSSTGVVRANGVDIGPTGPATPFTVTSGATAPSIAGNVVVTGTAWVQVDGGGDIEVSLIQQGTGQIGAADPITAPAPGGNDYRTVSIVRTVAADLTGRTYTLSIAGSGAMDVTVRNAHVSVEPVDE